ncbi:hypothetical protein KAI32_00270 [Candidatus Pacearchaeota archaeon]|nr:hypothetical protein [Candidatus Pacearchaeota archaeon]
MRVLLHQDKKAISNIVAYVLLISITIGLSITVYNWLRFYVSEEIVEQCPDSVNIIIEDYNCTSGTNGFLNITLKNKGLFSVDGYILRVHDSSDAEFGFYVLTDTGTPITPGAKDITIYPFNESYNGKNFTSITLVEVQPFLTKKGTISCKSYASQKIICQ